MVCQLLVDCRSNDAPAVREQAAALLIDHAVDFVNGRAHRIILGSIERVLAVEPRVGTLRENLERVIAAHNVKAEISNDVRAAIASLPQDLPNRIRVLVEGWPVFRDREERGLPPRPDHASVAGEIPAAPDRSSMIALLFEPWAKSSGELLVALARRGDADAAWRDVLAAARRRGETWGASLFASAAIAAHRERLALLPLAHLESDDQFERDLGAETITRIEAPTR